MNDRLTTVLVIATAALLVGASLGAGAAGLFEAPEATADGGGADGDAKDRSGDERGLETFESTEAFEAYFEAAAHAGGGPPAPRSRPTGDVDDVEEEVVEEADAVESDDAESAEEATDAYSDESSGDDGSERHSETNVQEASLDEPDVLKTDGDSVYYAGHHFQRGAHETSILDIDDPADPEVVATIPATGELLLVEETDTLVVFSDERIWGYDVSDPSDPEQTWNERIDASLQTARLYDGSLYLVLVDRPDHGDDPCPLVPYGDEPIECTDVYRPDGDADADAVYTAARVDPATGAMEDETSVVGSVRDSATYVSEEAIYLSYTRSTSEYDMLTGYLTGPGAEHLDPDTVERIEDLEDLDISERAKRTELHEIMDEWFASLDDDRRETQRDLDTGLTEYAEDNQRELTTTGIARISIDGDLDVTADGEVPGYPLNQWSMDEHDDHLRIATTIPGVHGADSENDVYVLDDGLDVTGSVEGLGETERIYAVRFQGDEGYVVTFREIDPFYTLDLSDPANPEMEGELKIPGFSNYLHPLDDEGDLVLGVGEEDGKVKLSTFDVSDRDDPVEIHAKILENERFSEANRNHRAFLHDERHGVFFLPAGEYSYVFSYEDGELVEEARVDAGGPGVRAMYVDDYLYVFGPEEVIVLDETTWEVETRVDAR